MMPTLYRATHYPRNAHTGITSMAFSRDSLQLATASFDGVSHSRSQPDR